jgi:hypothetical protein
MAKKQTELSVLVEIRDLLKTRFPEVEIPWSKGKFYDLLVSPTRFQKLPDGWIKDHLLGLDWGPSSDKTMNWEAAENYASNLGAGVRPPEIWELETLCDRSRREPATFTPFINDTKFNDWYWTSTPVAGYSSVAWCVGFDSGTVGSYDKDDTNYVRPVRSSQ